MLRLFLLGCVLASVSGQGPCEPGVNCELPNCRCWFDDEIPGALDAVDTPQMVLVTFEDAINTVNADIYRSLFQEPNPNGCPGRGTFFIKDLDTDYSVIKDLYDEGHEIGAGSLDGSFPSTQEDWQNTLKTIKDKLANVGVSEDDVKGVRGPELRAGGIEEFIGLGDNGYEYDATCTTTEFDTQANLKWPYTYDFLPSPTCNDGSAPEAEFPGKWQYLLAALSFNGTKCASPSGCTGVRTQTDVFDMFDNSFLRHYEGSRSPFVVVVDIQFVLVPFKLAGLQEFLEYVRAAFPDTWVLPMYKGLDWVKTPIPNDNITNFQPWSC